MIAERIADLRQAEYRYRHEVGVEVIEQGKRIVIKWNEKTLDTPPESPMTKDEAEAIQARDRQIQRLLRRTMRSSPKKAGRVCQFPPCTNALAQHQPRFCCKDHGEANRQRERRRRQSERRTIAALAPNDHNLIASVVDHESYFAALETLASENRYDSKLAAYCIRMSTPYTIPGRFTKQTDAEGVLSCSHWHDAGHTGDREAVECKLSDERRHRQFEDYGRVFFPKPGQGHRENEHDESVSLIEQRGLHEYLSIQLGVVSDEAQVSESEIDRAIRSRN